MEMVFQRVLNDGHGRRGLGRGVPAGALCSCQQSPWGSWWVSAGCWAPVEASVCVERLLGRR